MMMAAAQSPAISLEERAIGAYLGLAVGDALGATTEFLTPREIRAQYGVHHRLCGGGWLRLRPGQVTDDTGMSLALGESILVCGGVEAHAVARAFSDWMRAKPVDIGHTVRRGIIHYRSTGEPRVPENEHDAGNGACMRCLPVALSHWRESRETLAEATRIQSHVTHHNRVADAGTEVVVRMLVAALKGATKSTLEGIALGLVDRYKIYRYDRRSTDNPSGWIVETLRAVFQAFFSNQGLEGMLIDVVNRGGDSDTTGAIAGMLAGALHGRAAIPKRWLRVLDPEVRRACERQALALLQLADRRAGRVR